MALKKMPCSIYMARGILLSFATKQERPPAVFCSHSGLLTLPELGGAAAAEYPSRGLDFQNIVKRPNKATRNEGTG